MIKLSRMTDYAVVVLSQLATHGRGVQTVGQLADGTGLSEPTVAKVLKSLVPAGLVVSHRGVHGGYVLARPAELISVAAIVTALEGPIALAACVSGGEGNCSVEGLCPIRGNWERVNQAIKGALEAVSLADVMVPDRDPRPSGASLAEPIAGAPYRTPWGAVGGRGTAPSAEEMA